MFEEGAILVVEDELNIQSR